MSLTTSSAAGVEVRGTRHPRFDEVLTPAALDFVAWQRLRDTGPGVLAFIALLAVASYGAFWVWMQSQKYG